MGVCIWNYSQIVSLKGWSYGLVILLLRSTLLVTFCSHGILSQRQETKDFVYVKRFCLCWLLFNFFSYIYFWRKYHCHRLTVHEGWEMVKWTKSGQHQLIYYGVWISHLKYLCCSVWWKFCKLKVLKTNAVWPQPFLLLSKM